MAKKKGINTAQRSHRLATEGLINVATGKKGSVIVEINSETDFVAEMRLFKSSVMMLQILVWNMK